MADMGRSRAVGTTSSLAIKAEGEQVLLPSLLPRATFLPGLCDLLPIWLHSSIHLCFDSGQFLMSRFPAAPPTLLFQTLPAPNLSSPVSCEIPGLGCWWECWQGPAPQHAGHCPHTWERDSLCPGEIYTHMFRAWVRITYIYIYTDMNNIYIHTGGVKNI